MKLGLADDEKRAIALEAKRKFFAYVKEARELVDYHERNEWKGLNEPQKFWLRIISWHLEVTEKHRYPSTPGQEYTVRRDRKARKSMPKWADQAEIDAVYRRCWEMNVEAEEVIYHVDHIIPLCGKSVSGLHIASNLRIITKVENYKKRNHFDEALLEMSTRIPAAGALHNTPRANGADSAPAG